MGSPVSPVIANIFMEDLEDKAFASYPLVPRVWYRFVDNIISVVKKNGAQWLLTHLNNQPRRINFTMEVESSDSLPLMDVRFTRQAGGELMREVYQKPTHTNCYVHFDSHHPLSVKSDVVECLANRAITIRSSGPACDVELKRIKQVMAANGYPKRFVEKAISRQLKRSAMRPTPTALQDRSTSERDSRQVTVSIPFINDLSQEVRRIARVARVR